MKITYQREGGVAFFPGLSRPFEIDSAGLPAEQAAHLEQLCAAARVFERPQGALPAPGVADVFSYTLIIRWGRRRRTLRLHDPVEDRALRALIDFVESLRPEAS